MADVPKTFSPGPLAWGFMTFIIASLILRSAGVGNAGFFAFIVAAIVGRLVSSLRNSPENVHDFDRIILRNGDELSGNILTSEFNVEAANGALSITGDQIKSIKINKSPGATDLIAFENGGSVRGAVANTTIEMTLRNGERVTLEKVTIARIVFSSGD